MSKRRVTQIPVTRGGGAIPTGAVQFHEDAPGLYLQGEDAQMWVSDIQELAERLANHPDLAVAAALSRLSRYVEIITRDVIAAD